MATLRGGIHHKPLYHQKLGGLDTRRQYRGLVSEAGGLTSAAGRVRSRNIYPEAEAGMLGAQLRGLQDYKEKYRHEADTAASALQIQSLADYRNKSLKRQDRSLELQAERNRRLAEDAYNNQLREWAKLALEEEKAADTRTRRERDYGLAQKQHELEAQKAEDALARQQEELGIRQKELGLEEQRYGLDRAGAIRSAYESQLKAAEVWEPESLRDYYPTGDVGVLRRRPQYPSKKEMISLGESADVYAHSLGLEIRDENDLLTDMGRRFAQALDLLGRQPEIAYRPPAEVAQMAMDLLKTGNAPAGGTAGGLQPPGYGAPAPLQRREFIGINGKRYIDLGDGTSMEIE